MKFKFLICFIKKLAKCLIIKSENEHLICNHHEQHRCICRTSCLRNAWFLDHFGCTLRTRPRHLLPCSKTTHSIQLSPSSPIHPALRWSAQVLQSNLQQRPISLTRSFLACIAESALLRKCTKMWEPSLRIFVIKRNRWYLQFSI